jgi:hypothetical protein
MEGAKKPIIHADVCECDSCLARRAAVKAAIEHEAAVKAALEKVAAAAMAKPKPLVGIAKKEKQITVSEMTMYLSAQAYE